MYHPIQESGHLRFIQKGSCTLLAKLHILKAPEMFHGLQNFTWLSISRAGEEENVWIYIFGWSIPLSSKLLHIL